MPRIKMTPTAKITLRFLVVYVAVLLSLIIWKFVSTVVSGGA